MYSLLKPKQLPLFQNKILLSVVLNSFRFSYAAIAKATLLTARVASITSIAKLNLSRLPRIKSDTLDWLICNSLAASACVQPCLEITSLTLAIKSERIFSTNASSFQKPRSINMLPLDLIIFSFIFSPVSVCIGFFAISISASAVLPVFF